MPRKPPTIIETIETTPPGMPPEFVEIVRQALYINENITYVNALIAEFNTNFLTKIICEEVIEEDDDDDSGETCSK